MYTPKLLKAPANRSGSTLRLAAGVLGGALLGSLLPSYTGYSTVDDVERIMSFRVVHDYPKLVVLVGRSVADVPA